eukprot:1186108-Prorocentrum_minimum.AAC.2
MVYAGPRVSRHHSTSVESLLLTISSKGEREELLSSKKLLVSANDSESQNCADPPWLEHFIGSDLTTRLKFAIRPSTDGLRPLTDS